MALNVPLVPIGCAHRRFHFDNHADDVDDAAAATTAEDVDWHRHMHTKSLIHLFISYG